VKALTAKFDLLDKGERGLFRVDVVPLKVGVEESDLTTVVHQPRAMGRDGGCAHAILVKQRTRKGDLPQDPAQYQRFPP